MKKNYAFAKNEIHKKAIAFFTHEFDSIIIPPFVVSNMVKSKTLKKQSEKCLAGHIIDFDNV